MEPSTSSAWRRALAVLWCCNFLAALGMMTVLPFFPLYLRDLGVPQGRSVVIWSGLLVGAAPFSAALMAGVWGAIGDQVGRRAMVLRSLLGIALFVGLMGFARSPVQLLLLRFGQGLFSGFMAPTLTLLSVLSPDARQGRVSSWLQTAVLTGGAFGPALGGFLAVQSGFPVMAWTCSGLALTAALVVRLLVPEPPLERKVEPDADRDLLTSATAVLQSALRQLLATLKNPFLRRLFLALFLVRVAAAAPNPTLVLFVEKLVGEVSASASKIGSLVFACYPVAVLLALPVWGRIADLRRPRTILLLCIGGGIAATIGMALARTPFQLGLFRFAFGAVLAGVFPAGFAVVARASDRSERGGATGLAFSALAFGLSFGPWLASIVESLLGYRALLAVCAGLLLLALIRVYRQPRNE